jgi:hypothetical protein
MRKPRNVCHILMSKSHEMWSFGRLRRMWDNNTRICLMEINGKCEWTELSGGGFWYWQC